MNETIKRLKEALQRISTPEPRSLDTSFRKNEVKPDFTVEQYNYVMTAAHAVPDLLTYIKELEKKAEAGEKLAEAVSKDIGFNEDCMFCGFKDKQRNSALAAYDQAIK